MGIFDALFNKAKPTPKTEPLPERHELFWNKLQEKTGRKEKFAAIPYTLLDGTVISYDEDTKVGFEGEMEGEFEPLHAGTYDLADGTTLRVEAAMPQMADMANEISGELAGVPVEPATDPSALSSDFASYILDDGRKIEIGTVGEAVMIDGAPATEGLYTTTDGLRVTVDAGGLLVEVMSAATFESFQKQVETFADEKNAEVEKLKIELEAAKALVEKQNAEVVKLSRETVRPTNNQETNPRISELVALSQAN